MEKKLGSPSSRSPSQPFSPAVFSKTGTRHNSFDFDEDIPQVTRELVDPSLPPRTKIICTLGPATNTYELIKKMFEQGMNVARLDLAYGTRKDHEDLIHIVRDVMSDTRRIVALMHDLKGPDVRVGNTVDGKEVLLEKGQKYQLYPLSLSSDQKLVTDKTRCFVNFKDLLKLVKKIRPFLLMMV